MELKHFFPKYPQISTETTRDFNGLITSKGEFADLKLHPVEDIPDYGDFYNSQKIIRNYMNGYSPYTNLLLLHKMGSGKTCTAIAVAEHLIKINRVKKVIILCRGEKLIQSFQKEMVMNCTGGKYIPEEITDMASFYKQSKKLFKRWYIFSTYYKFARKLQEYNRSSEYEGCLFILDEVHNMKDEEGESDGFDIYAEIHEMLVKKLKNKMCLLLSGTPMMNSATEIAGVLNLLNPPDLQLGPGWEKEYLNKSQVFLPRKRQEFSKYTKGKVSYLDNMVDIHVQINHIGTSPHGADSKFNVVMLKMSDYQTGVYMDAYNDDDNTKLWLQPRQISNMAPAETPQKMVRDLGKYSVKFETILETIQKNRAKNTFIFSTFIQYGIYGFQDVLEYNGYTQTTMRNAETPGLKYAVITSETPAGYSRFIIDVFNRDENKNGELIHVLIGSESISEGFSFKNVQHIHIMNPHWNYGKIEQAIYRGIRLNSHRALGSTVNVDIFKYVAVPNTPTSEQDSIDLQMYNVCEKKDVSIMSIEKQLAITSFDCILFQERNKLKTCECNDFFPRDESTQDMYHLDDYKSPIIDFIYSKLRISNSVDITTLPFSPFKVFSVINNMMMKNKPVRNKYGYLSSLVLEGNNLRIVSNIINPVPFYNDNMIMVSKMVSVQEMNEIMNRKEWGPAMTDHEKKSIIQTMDVKQQAEIVETHFHDRFIEEYYKDYIFATTDEVYFHNIKAIKGPFRVLDNQGRWRNSRKTEYDDFNKIVLGHFHDTYKNNTGVYGIQPFDKNKSIKLRDLAMMIENNQSKGLSIVSCKKPYLHELLRIMYPERPEEGSETIKKAAEMITQWLGDNNLIFYELF